MEQYNEINEVFEEWTKNRNPGLEPKWIGHSYANAYQAAQWEGFQAAEAIYNKKQAISRHWRFFLTDHPQKNTFKTVRAVYSDGAFECSFSVSLKLINELGFSAFSNYLTTKANHYYRKAIIKASEEGREV